MRHNPLRAAARVAVLAGLAASTAWGATGSAPATAPDQAARRVLAAAREQLGDAYRYGGSGPDAWDCSGLTSTMWRTVGGVKDVPRTSRDQQKWAWPIAERDARPGDLVFFGDPVTHVSLYLGDGRVLDASSSRKQVVERAVWRSDVLRFGRVPRAGVARPPAPRVSATPAPSAKPTPSGRTTASPAPRASAKPAPRPTATGQPASRPSPAAMRPVPGRGHRPASRPPQAVSSFVSRATGQAGHAWAAKGTGPAFDAAGLVRWSWWRSGLGVLPDTAAGIERRAVPVRLADLRVGDLVFYGAPAVHVGIYVGGGRMVDASRVLRSVVVRDVFTSETVRFARLPLDAARRR